MEQRVNGRTQNPATDFLCMAIPAMEVLSRHGKSEQKRQMGADGLAELNRLAGEQIRNRFGADFPNPLVMVGRNV